NSAIRHRDGLAIARAGGDGFKIAAGDHGGSPAAFAVNRVGEVELEVARAHARRHVRVGRAADNTDARAAHMSGAVAIEGTDTFDRERACEGSAAVGAGEVCWPLRAVKPVWRDETRRCSAEPVIAPELGRIRECGCGPREDER